jgi:hypothetical protein
MIVSIDWMKESFHVLNQKYFNGQLPEPYFGLSRARTQLGTMSFKRIRHFRRMVLSDFTIRLTTYYDMTEWQAKNVLLHEMIHYDIGYHRLQDTSSHGILFHTKMNELNQRYGWKITVRTSTKGWKVADWVRTNPTRRITSSVYLMLVLRLTTGQYFLSRVNPKFIWLLEEKLDVESTVAKHVWYTSELKEFADYPQVRSLRGRHLTQEELRRFQPDLQEFHLKEKSGVSTLVMR